MTDLSPDDEYFLEIESHFALRRGTAFVFSAKDWALMKSWRGEGVPIAVVLEAIDRCFDHRTASGRKAPISSLSYCRHAVVDLWEERKDLKVGEGGTVPETDPAPLLERLANELDAAMEHASSETLRAVLAAAAGEVRAIRPLEAVPVIEERLLSVENRLLSSMEAAMSPQDLASLRAEVETALGGHKLEESVAARTRQANLRRLVRRRFGLPRLSLFG